MNEYIQNIENIFKELLLKRVQIFINKKLYKEGQFTLFTYNYFSINIHLKNDKKKKMEILKIPLPFDVIKSRIDEPVILDYRISTFAYHNKAIENKVMTLAKATLSRYFNNVVVIKVKP